jgi:RNA polymerase sigma-70 factor, ECF subfamily
MKSAVPETRAVEAHLYALHRFACALLRGERERADDLVQDSIERALAHWHQRRRDRELRSWLFTILYNRFVTDLRQRKREPQHGSLHDIPEGQLPGADGGQEQALACRDLLRGFAALPEDQRTVLLLITVENFSYEEAARILGIPIGTVMSRLSRCRERLRRYMHEGHCSMRPGEREAMGVRRQDPLPSGGRGHIVAKPAAALGRPRLETAITVS